MYTICSFRKLDGTADAERIQWYKAVMNGLATRLPAQNPRVLRAIAQVEISNTDTKTTIEAIFGLGTLKILLMY